nr:hypothetical protein [Virgibacillus profundi]
MVTFLMKKNKRRTLFACWVLVSIIGSNYNFTFGNLSVSFSFLFILCGAIIFLVQLPRLMYHLFASFTITIGYAAILFWEKISPVWVVLPRPLLLSFLIILLIIILTKSLDHRLGIGALGISAGEYIYSLTLSGYGFYESIGQASFLENLVVTIVIITFLDILHKWKHKFFSPIHKYNESIGEVAK